MVGQGLSWVTKGEQLGFRVLWSPPSRLPDLIREHWLLQAPRASVLLPQTGRAGPHPQQHQLPVPQLELREVPGQLSPGLQPAQRGGRSWGAPSTAATPQGHEVALRSQKSN